MTDVRLWIRMCRGERVIGEEGRVREAQEDEGGERIWAGGCGLRGVDPAMIASI